MQPRAETHTQAAAQIGPRPKVLGSGDGAGAASDGIAAHPELVTFFPTLILSESGGLMLRKEVGGHAGSVGSWS